MKNSILDIYESLLKKSLSVSHLVTLASKKDANFLPEFEIWLVELEQLLEKNRMAKCSEIAGLRSKIVSARYSQNKQVVNKRKRIVATAVEVVYEAQRTLLDVLEPMQQKIDEAKDGIRQLLGVAYQANMIDKTLNFNEMIQQLWFTFSTHEQLKGLTSKILVSVNKTDALRLLAEEIDLEN